MIRVGLGCVNLGSSTGPSEREGVRLVHAALDAGVTVFDTSDAYGAGASEQVLGRALRGRRDGIEIATKGGYIFESRSAIERRARRLAAPAIAGLRRVRAAASTADESSRVANAPAGGAYESQDFSSTHLSAALDESLRRLGVEQVDVYQLHGPGRADSQLLDTLRELVDGGKVRSAGIGAESLSSAASWVRLSGEHQSAGVDVVQLPFGPLDPEAADDVFPDAQRHEVDLWVRGVFGGGVFQMLHHQVSALSASDRDKAAAVREIAHEVGLDLYEFAIAFTRSFAGVSTIVLGTSSIEHLQRNVELVRSTEPLAGDTVRRVIEVVTASKAEHGITGGGS